MKKGITDILVTISKTSLYDEDEDKLSVDFIEGISPETLAYFQSKFKMKLPSELIELFFFTNGLGLFGLDIMSIEEIQYFSEEDIFLFHNWGNGDFDGINSKNEIFFMHHSPNNLYFVSNSLCNWLKDVVFEIKTKGVLKHPSDYSFNEEDGVYKSIHKILFS